MKNSVTVIDIVARVTDETTRGARSAEGTVSRLERSMRKMQERIDGMRRTRLEVTAALNDTATAGIQRIASAGRGLAGKTWTVTLKAVDLVTAPFRKIMSLVSNPITQVLTFAGVSLGAADTINTYKSFEQGMANVGAVTGGASDAELPGIIQAAKAAGVLFEEGSNASETAMNALTATAKKLGETTEFSASQASEAMEYLAMAGWKSSNIIAGMPGLLSLASAGGVELGTAADVTSSVLAQYGMNAGESERVADVLAATATNSKTNVTGLGESFKYAGGVAGQLGYSVEDTALAIGIMGNSSIDGSMAGTALRTGLMRLSKQEGMTAEESNAMAKAARRLGISIKNSDGSMKGLKELLIDLRRGFAGVTDTAERTTLATALFGQYASSGMLALMDTSEEGERKFNALAAAIENSKGAAKEMADKKMDTLQGSLKLLQSAAEGVKIAIGEKLNPYLRGFIDWLTARMPEVQNVVGGAVDFITGRIDGMSAAFRAMTDSPEWRQAETPWEKMKLSWRKVIAEPFDAWWNSEGKAWLSEQANSLGRGIGTALRDGILALLGIDAHGAAADGVEIGKSFASGFLEGFNGAEVGKAIAQAVATGLKSLIGDAATLLPGGREATGTSPFSAALLGFGAFKAASTVPKIWRGAKTVVGGVRTARDVTSGVKIFNAAANGSKAAESALGMARLGQLGAGTAFGAAIAPMLKTALKTAPVLGTLTSLFQTGADAYNGAGKAEEWIGSNSIGAKAASAWGAAAGGLGDGIFGDETPLRKFSNIFDGALKGSGIGTAAGGGVGALIGAGVGAAGAAIGGSNIAKGLYGAGDAIGGFVTETIPDMFGKFFTETLPQKWDELAAGLERFFLEGVPYALGYAAGKVTVFFKDTLPQKWDELLAGLENFFAETLPNILPAICAGIRTFILGTVPGFFGNLWDGITSFFTESVQPAIENAGSMVRTFFTETLQGFFRNLWSGITAFITKTIPNAAEAIGNGITNFFNGVKEKITGFFSGILSRVTGSVSVGFGAATGGAQKHAEGGILTRPHLGLVAEDGAEAIIPLSSKRRGRGIDLWQKAGAALGVLPHADGGIMGIPDAVQYAGDVPVQGAEGYDEDAVRAAENTRTADGTAADVSVSIGQITFEIHVEGASDVQAITDAIKEDAGDMINDLAYRFARALQQQFDNMPITAWEG